jgi:outer membrane protein assembly factor BamB
MTPTWLSRLIATLIAAPPIPVGLMCSSAVHDGVVYVGSEHGELFALDVANGTQWWSFDAGSAIRSAPSISTRDGTLYLGAGNGKTYALDAKSGKKRWEFATDDRIVSSPCPHDGRVYIGSDDGYLYALEAE